MSYTFGKAFTYTFYPLRDNDNLTAAEITAMVSLLTAAYVFDSDSKPDRATAAAGTGALQTISSWTDNGNLGFNLAVTAIADPDVASQNDRYTYWMAINFRLQAAGQIQTVIRALPMHRVAGHHTRISVSDDDLTDIWAGVTDITANSTERSEQLDAVKLDLRDDLEQKGFDWAQVWRPDKLNRAATYRTLFYIARSKRKTEGDEYHLLAVDFNKEYQKRINELRLDFDAYSAGEPSGKVSTGGFALAKR